ncbi:hypothetical protein [Bifidobacterium aerophilum]|uniref:DUF559 domain-containing protein n=1 Tax=Bifidobacterium aerophilum TaxID=1798155 RepID=A0A6N9Z4V2_9BIFI|nr:hypothetical protein [Bifidobacterium aerophilum]NEG89511.1 hypothetical protein [Bifidobacterium aerophilum]
MSNESLSLTALTELKVMRMQACDTLQRHSRQRLIYALDTALELLSIEKPRTRTAAKQRGLIQTIVSSPSKRSHLAGVRYLARTSPIETQIVGRWFECTTPVCTWAHYASTLTLGELIVLAESMMRRDKRLKRAGINDFLRYLQQARQFSGIRKCRLALRVVQENTDSSMETRTRLVLMRYGLPAPVVNYELHLSGRARPLFIDMAYPELKIAIEYDGNHHRFSSAQVLADDKRREMIEDADWLYIKVTFVDLQSEAGEERLAQRVATAMEKTTKKPIPLEPRLTIEQVCDGHRLRRKPPWAR